MSPPKSRPGRGGDQVGYPTSQGAKDAVTDCMADGLVYSPEMVHVHEHDGHRLVLRQRRPEVGDK